MDRCRAAVALDAGSTAPFWASQNLRLWEVFAQLRYDNLGVTRDIAMSNNDSAAGVDDMLGCIFANDVRPAFDSADKTVRIDVLERTGLIIVFVNRSANQSNAEYISRKGAHGVYTAA